MAEAIESVSRRRGASVVLVNSACTSQMDSRYGILLGERKGDTFYCFDGEVLDADINAARNILARASDSAQEKRVGTAQLRLQLHVAPNSKADINGERSAFFEIE